jgi:hypothetical protein
MPNEHGTNLETPPGTGGSIAFPEKTGTYMSSIYRTCGARSPWQLADKRNGIAEGVYDWQNAHPRRPRTPAPPSTTTSTWTPSTATKPG